jgi:hypothetical protein
MATSLTNLSTLGAIIVSITTLVIFVASFVVAYLLNSETALVLLFGTAAANATTVVAYWVGSSSGSQKKDETIAGLYKASTTTSDPSPCPTQKVG